MELQDQEDLFQEIAIRVWRSIPSFRGDAAVATWIYRVALNTAITWSQVERRQREGKQSLDAAPPLTPPAAPAVDPRVEWLYGQIRQLSKVDRSLTLLLLDGFSYKEMASMLGMTENYVGVKINRIKAQLTSKSREENRYEV